MILKWNGRCKILACCGEVTKGNENLQVRNAFVLSERILRSGKGWFYTSKSLLPFSGYFPDFPQSDILWAEGQCVLYSCDFFYHFLMLQNLFHVLLPFVFEENSSSSSIPVHFPPMYCHPQRMKCHLGSLQAGSGCAPASHLFLTSCCYRRVRPQGLLSKLCRSSLLYCVFLFYLD